MRKLKLSDEDRAHKSSPSSSQYEQYKKSLHAIFDGKLPLPTHIFAAQLPDTAKVAMPDSVPTPAIGRKSRLIATAGKIGLASVDGIRAAVTKNEISVAVDLIIAQGLELPLEEDILSKALCHDDSDIKRRVLEKISSLVFKAQIRNPKLLRSRLENAALLAKSQDIHDHCLIVRDSIALNQ